MNYISLDECFLLRQANNDLKRIVDSTFQRLSTQHQEKFEAKLALERNRDFPKRKSLTRGQKLLTLEEVESIFRDTSTWLVPQGNPWLVGHVKLDLKLLDGLNHLRLLISRFGAHISRLTVLVNCHKDDNSERMVNMLLELLSSTNFPNPKQLRLHGFVTKEFTSILLERVDTLRELPKLEALNLIGFDGFFGRRLDGGHPSLPFLQKYGSQLSVFHCRSSLITFPSLSLDLLNNLLPNVCSLEVLLCSDGVPKLTQIGWKVKQLVLNLAFVKFAELL